VLRKTSWQPSRKRRLASGIPLRVVLDEKDWRIYRRAVTGVILFRTIWADIAVQKTDGKYYVYELTYEQQYNGKCGRRPYCPGTIVYAYC